MSPGKRQLGDASVGAAVGRWPWEAVEGGRGGGGMVRAGATLGRRGHRPPEEEAAGHPQESHHCSSCEVGWGRSAGHRRTSAKKLRFCIRI